MTKRSIFAYNLMMSLNCIYIQLKFKIIIILLKKYTHSLFACDHVTKNNPNN